LKLSDVLIGAASLQHAVLPPCNCSVHPQTDTDSSYRPGGAAPIPAPFSVSLIPSVFFEALMMMNAKRTPTMMNLTVKM